MQSLEAPARLDRRIVITALGVAQILAWGTSFYFPAVFASAIVADTGWSLGLVVSGTSIGLLVAGLISPQVGKLIDRYGARPIILTSPLFYAVGLSGVGFAPNLPTYLVSWLVIGIGMGTGLYDAVFAALGWLYGKEARQPITNLTLFGGFASTVCWPLSAFMIEHVGWRDACLIYAVLHLVLSLPLQLAVLPRMQLRSAEKSVAPDASRAVPDKPIDHESLIFALVALILSFAAGIGSIVIVNFMIFLQARGVDYAVAVSLGTLFGPAQVGARVIERLFGTRYHPIWTMIASCSLMAAGLLLLFEHFPILMVFILGLCDGLRHFLDRAGHLAARAVRAGPVSAFDGTDRVSEPDRAGAGAVGRRLADRDKRCQCHHRRIDRAGADQCAIDRLALVAMPGRKPAGQLKMLTLQTLYFEDLTLGQTERLAKTVASSDVVGFAEVTGDRNPIHLSEHFAAKTPFGTRIAHGLYTASLISAVLGTRLPGPGAVYISQTLNFRAPVKIGDTVDVSVSVAEVVPGKCRARLACLCAVGDDVVLDGEAWVKSARPGQNKGGRPLPRV